MYCRYCLQPIPDRSQRCPECGSNLTLEGEAQPLETRPAGQPAISPKASVTAVLVVLVVILLLCGGIGLLRPNWLPEPIAALFGQRTAGQIVPQAARTIPPTPTPALWQEYSNQRANFSIQFPEEWLVIHQGQANWRQEVEDAQEMYEWANAIFESERPMPFPQTRAVDPAVIDPAFGQTMAFTISQVDALLGRRDGQVDLDDLLTLAENEPEQLLEWAGPWAGQQVTSIHHQRLLINERETLFVELASSSTIEQTATRMWVRLYFIAGESDLYVAGYFAEEQLGNQNRDLYQQIIETFQPLE